MFNFDIRRAFSRLDTNPTPEFKAHLRARILPNVRHTTSDTRNLSPFRILTLSAATLVLIVGLTTLISPSNVNKALAEAIANTFSFNTEGFHHIKIALSMNTPGSTRSWIDEMWSDGTHAITEVTDPDAPFGWGGSYYDVPNNVECGVGAYQAEHVCNPVHDTQEWGALHNPTAEKEMSIQDVSIEHANDTHGDLYFTWITELPLTNATHIDTSVGPYGYIFGTWNGTYSWQNDSGQTVNRVTWFSEDRAQSPFNEGTHSFLVQIQEIAPENVGSYGAYEGEYLAQSPVYLIDLDTMTVMPVSDEWLATSRAEFDAKLIRDMASTDAMAREYEQSFQYALDIGTHLDAYTLITHEIAGDTETLTYDLDETHPIVINTVNADRVEFTREISTNLIKNMRIFSADNTIIYQVELLIFEQKDTAPEGFFTQESWEARVAEHR